ncbi:hypothetical protein FA13DRAFT_1865527 [Coprinellus micaceus]|uniref:Uncharacterized protein n=1 Tax=Coprinellus micaceus TaxID=71717 RepID=A0A4Y7T734_COPMI|nr:hypothetical protein FA13DRAFT_1865527 [Coprinellus micaceus]
MAPGSWATPAEREFLASLIPEYEACQVKRRYKAFWQRLDAEFLVKFPVLEKLFPDRSVKAHDLQPHEKEIYAAAVLKQQQEWYRWQLSPRSRSAGSVITKKDLQSIYCGRTRNRKPYEVFAKLYSKEVDEAKEARCEAQGITGRKRLSVWQSVSKELYDSSSREKKEAVRKAIEKEDLQEWESADAPIQYLRYLKKLPALLDATINPAVRRAGALAFVTVAAPDPEQNGKVVCKSSAFSFQFGNRPGTPLFAEVWEGHSGVFVEELSQFVRRHEFPPDVCAARSLRKSHEEVQGSGAEACRLSGAPSPEFPTAQVSASAVVTQAAPTQTLGEAPAGNRLQQAYIIGTSSTSASARSTFPLRNALHTASFIACCDRNDSQRRPLSHEPAAQGTPPSSTCARPLPAPPSRARNNFFEPHSASECYFRYPLGPTVAGSRTLGTVGEGEGFEGDSSGQSAGWESTDEMDDAAGEAAPRLGERLGLEAEPRDDPTAPTNAPVTRSKPHPLARPSSPPPPSPRPPSSPSTSGPPNRSGSFRRMRSHSVSWSSDSGESSQRLSAPAPADIPAGSSPLSDDAAATVREILLWGLTRLTLPTRRRSVHCWQLTGQKGAAAKRGGLSLPNVTGNAGSLAPTLPRRQHGTIEFSRSVRASASRWLMRVARQRRVVSRTAFRGGFVSRTYGARGGAIFLTRGCFPRFPYGSRLERRRGAISNRLLGLGGGRYSLASDVRAVHWLQQAGISYIQTLSTQIAALTDFILPAEPPTAIPVFRTVQGYGTNTVTLLSSKATPLWYMLGGGNSGAWGACPTQAGA